MKTKLCTIVVAAVMIVATLFVSCAPSKAVADDTVSVFFGELQAKAINSEVYETDADTESGFGASTVVIPEVSALYWSYKAVKADGNLTAGQTTDMENNVNGYMPVKDGAGLDNTISGLSKGDWNFELQAFASAADRTAGTPVLFYGKTAEAQNLVNTSNVVKIDTEWQYPEGTAENVHFEITTDLIQNLTTDIKEPYKVSKVTVQYDGQDAAVELKAGNTSDSTDDSDATKHTYTTVWTGDMKNTVPNGTQSFTYKFYVDGQEEISTSVTAPVMTNLITNITGTATVTLTAGSVSVDFSGSTVPKDQPTISAEDTGTTYSISYEIGSDATAATGNPTEYTRYTDTNKNTAVTISNAPSWAGHTFKGWKLSGTADSTASKTYTISATTTGSITLVAVWTANSSSGGSSKVEVPTVAC